MSMKTLVVGLGEVGGPLLEIIRSTQEAYGIDIQPPGAIPHCDIMHICFPYIEHEKFIAEAVRYIAKYNPLLTIINSTVGPGTTRTVSERAGAEVAYSPVRGKHVKMRHDMHHYMKFVGALTPTAGQKACAHFESVGMKTKLLSSPEAAELAKLTETTYFGVLIAWAQEVERYCKEFGANYDEVISFYDEIAFFPRVKYFPGVIGGHCVMPNIKILKQHFASGILDAVEKSNQIKVEGKGSNAWRS